MASKLFVLIGVCLLQGTWSYPSPAEVGASTSTSVSAGTGTTASTGTTAGSKLSSDFRSKLAAVLGNTQTGITSVSTPAIKMAVDTVPGVVNSGVQTVAQKVAKLSEANKENSAKIAAGLTNAVGGGVTLGSALAGGLMQMAGGGLDAVNKVVDSGAKGALSVGGQMADNGISRLGTLATLGQGFLDTAADGMTAAGGGVTVFTDGITKVIESISKRMEQGIKNAADTMTKLMEERATATNANIATAATNLQSSMYVMLNNYVDAMSNMQSMMETVMKAIYNSEAALSASTSTAATSTDGTGASATVTATV